MMQPLFRSTIIAVLGVAFFVVLSRADEQDAQLDRIEAAAGSCVVTVNGCEPDLEPLAPDAVRIAICEAGYDALRIPGRANPVLAAPSCARQLPRPNAYVDVLLGKQSLADSQVCTAWQNGTECPDNDRCLAGSTPAHFLCRCSGSGFSRRNGTRTIEGLFVSWQGIDPGTCPPSSHEGCAVMMRMTRAQYHVLSAIAADESAEYPAGLKAIIDAMRSDPVRARRRADVPACIRGNIPVRAGRGDIDGNVDFDGGAP